MQRGERRRGWFGVHGLDARTVEFKAPAWGCGLGVPWLEQGGVEVIVTGVACICSRPHGRRRDGDQLDRVGEQGGRCSRIWLDRGSMPRCRGGEGR